MQMWVQQGAAEEIRSRRQTLCGSASAESLQSVRRVKEHTHLVNSLSLLSAAHRVCTLTH
jgi:hypothetical protein